jgi:hypothetical protein
MRYFWQFKNGTVGPIDFEILYETVVIQGTRIKNAWDRSLGGYVFYER